MRLACKLRNDRRGHATMLFAGALTMLCGVGAIVIDAGTLAVEKRRLQGIADAAALAAAADPGLARPAAEAALTLRPGAPVSLTALQRGSYAADPSVSPGDRFRPDSAGAAVRLEVASTSPTYFARAFGLTDAVPITARATATRVQLAAFSIGSRVAAVDGGLPNAILSSLAGTDLRLGLLDYRALAAAQIDILRFVDGLRLQLALDGADLATVLTARPTLPQVARAAAATVDDPAVAAILTTLAGRLPAEPVALDRLINLGPLGLSRRIDGAVPIKVEVLTLLRALLTVDGSHDVASDLTLGIPGLASTRLRLAVGAPAAGSPWLAVDAARGVTVRTAQTRLSLDVTLAGAAPLGLGPIHVPFYLDLAPAEATLTDVSCAQGRARAAATLDVTPSVGTVAIADADPASFADFARPVALRPATIVRLPLVTVSGFAEERLGRRTRPVTFDAAAIAAATPKTVTTDDVLAATVASLLSRTNLRADVIGIGLDDRMITVVLGPVLTAAAGPLDLLLNQVAALAGVGIGQADVWVNGVRCGTPMLVG